MALICNSDKVSDDSSNYLLFIAIKMQIKLNMFQQICLLLVLSVVATFIEASEYDNLISHYSSNGRLQPSFTCREHFKPPSLFNFEYFKSLFKRHYASFAEEMVRQKLYLERASRAFVSAVNYKFRKASHYLAINHMSDWTIDEVRQIYIEDTGLRVNTQTSLEDSPKLHLAANPSDSERNLLNIEIDDYRELKNSTLSDTESREISLDDLVHKPAGTVELDKDDRSVFESSGWFNWESLGEKKETEEGNALSFLNSLIDAARDTFFNQQTETKRIKSLPDLVIVDHRSSPCYQAPRSQGRCGSCYAFATIALYEWLFCQKTGELVQFSEQYVVDCGDRIGMDGCKGAKFTEVSRFVQEFGLEIRGNYPYVGKDHKCPFKAGDPTDSFGYLRPTQDEGFTSVPLVYIGPYLNHNPFVINIHVNRYFSEYSGGVDMMDSWQDFGQLHSVLVVGSGRQDGDTYWLIRNSLSEDFGEAGHYKLNKRTSCIDPEYGYVLNADFKPSLEENLNKNYDGNRIINALIEHPTIWDRIERRS